ncbi:type II toxin-antitoxin system PemK/MazF family toxin [Streptomyces sp. SID13031]|uniref:type II toxin-antitoxin system PemK/MazF family toxin n=1 Tax=Streptomyces sp. SID13031 TaxID=2706046 RepID=UPI0013C605A0|nr:type II toxin-antitoxin system PemK/MazF family toxin [Streptomyces sp. SID13031]NEA32185.1 type II toxin-antitoxin system PemK/MazF family toxin [Streptomyces sp. SID13031]
MAEVARPEYAGDYEGTVHVEYTPHPDDGVADPGEVVWTWVPFEEDHHRGKDRPVLVVGSDGPNLLALILTSKDHDRDAADEARWGRVWLDIGSGPWDTAGRNSEVRLDRVLRIDPAEVRREGAAIGEDIFDQVAANLHDLHRA